MFDIKNLRFGVKEGPKSRLHCGYFPMTKIMQFIKVYKGFSFSFFKWKNHDILREKKRSQIGHI
jgi:hypothetical protein